MFSRKPGPPHALELVLAETRRAGIVAFTYELAPGLILEERMREIFVAQWDLSWTLGEVPMPLYARLVDAKGRELARYGPADLHVERSAWIRAGSKSPVTARDLRPAA